MTISQRVSGVATDGLGVLDLPAAAKFSMFNLLGVDAATSLADQLSGSTSLTAHGVPTYHTNYAEFTGGAYLTNASSASAGRSTFILTQDIANPPLAGNPPAVPQPGDIAASTGDFVSWNAGAQFCRQIGGELTFRPENGAVADAVATGTGYTIAVVPPMYFPDGSIVIPKRWKMLVLNTVASGNHSMMAQDEVPLRTYLAARGVFVIADSATTFMGGCTGTYVGRAALIAQANGLTGPEILAAYAYFRDVCAKRGIIF